jgi:ribosomal-protein-serine acetyltransferase
MFRREIAPGIEIRQFELSDAEELFDAICRNREYLWEWMPWVDATQGPEDIRNFISRTLVQYEGNQGPQCGIWVDGEIAGSVGCHPIDWFHRNCSIGYWIDQTRQKQGIVTRCSRTLLDYLFQEMLLHRVEIRCATGNTKSCAIPERLGFTREGVSREAEWVGGRWVDLVVWSMLQHEWARLSGAFPQDPANATSA